MSILGIISKREVEMKQYDLRQCVEIFHLLFLNQLGRKVDKKLYALKGGCNMRFYFKSIRYSEDMDIDIHTINKDTLFKNVNQILNSNPFKQILQSHGIDILGSSSPKQTPTTQRWKVTLKSKYTGLPLHTKIEFSRRDLDVNTSYELIDSSLLRQYSLAPIMANHYSMQTMFNQKIRALAGRSETQSRDIFDLYLLIESGNHFGIDEGTAHLLSDAKSKAEGITFEDFKGQVIAYLPLEYQNQYDDELVWESIINKVITVLDEDNYEIN